jgi:hypothetical protein
MSKFWKVAPWVTRLILMFPALLFLRIGIHNLSNVTGVLGARGIAFTSGFGVTVGRVGFGGFPLACGLFLIGCLFFERYLLSALFLVATLDVVVLIVRVASMFADSSVRENIPLVGAELLLLSFTAVGIVIESLGKRRELTAGVAPTITNAELGGTVLRRR